MGQDAKVIYDRRAESDRRSNDDPVTAEQRVFGERRKNDGLELSTADLDADEFDEVFKQFQTEENKVIDDAADQAENNLEIIDYQVLYRKGVECAYITLLKTDEQEQAPTLYAFKEEQENADSALERAPLHVQNIFGEDAYESYIEQGWNDISKTENVFPWALKSWLALHMKQDEIKSR